MTVPDFDSEHFKDDGTECPSIKDCPLTATHSRLREAHRHFHDADRHYSDLDTFTTYINSCIQSLRNVTFVLQKCKGSILGFDDWYGPWQSRLKEDSILRWVVDARNHIVKSGDLETLSVANIAVIRDYSSPPEIQVPFALTESVEVLSEALIDRLLLPLADRRNAILRVERRWVSSDLPGVELLNALSHSYTTLSYLIRDAHRPLRRVVQQSDSLGSLPGQPLRCMVGLGDSRVFYSRFQDKHSLSVQTHEIDPSELSEERAIERYGEVPAPENGPLKHTDTIVPLCRYLFGLARMMMEKDNHHESFVFYLTDTGMEIGGFRPWDKADSLLLWRSVAQKVEHLRAHAIIHIGEVWTAPFDPSVTGWSPTESPTRQEGLALTAISSSGEHVHWMSRTYRTHDGVILGDTLEYDGISTYFMEPVLRVWKTMFTRAAVAPVKPIETETGQGDG